MKITVEHDDGKREVFQYVTDAFLAIKQDHRGMSDDGQALLVPATKSYSWGNNVRELVKELVQATLELQDYLRKLRP